jgi:transcriptional regulator
MYIPKEFKVSDRKSIKTFISKYNFGMLIMNGMDGMPVVSHLPFVFKEKDKDFVLEFHLAKANHQANLIKNGTQGKFVVNGPNAYVSSSVYSHINVPTFNYQTIHLMGSLEVLSKEELISHSKELVTLFENDGSLYK